MLFLCDSHQDSSLCFMVGRLSHVIITDGHGKDRFDRSSGTANFSYQGGQLGENDFQDGEEKAQPPWELPPIEEWILSIISIYLRCIL